MLRDLVPAIIGWIVVIIILSMSPTIAGYNTAITTNVTAAVNATSMVAMSTITPFGGFLIIITLLLSTGVFAFAASKTKSAGTGDLIAMVGTLIIVIFTLSIYGGTLVGSFDALITAGSAGMEKTVYGFFPILTYVAILAATPDVAAWRTAGMLRKGKKSSFSTAGLP